MLKKSWYVLLLTFMVSIQEWVLIVHVCVLIYYQNFDIFHTENNLFLAQNYIGNKIEEIVDMHLMEFFSLFEKLPPKIRYNIVCRGTLV